MGVFKYNMGGGAQITICVRRGAHEKRLGTTGLRNVLIIISRGLTVGDGKTRMAIQLD